MKGLFQYLQEENTTPGNTIGMGDSVVDDGGSEPLTTTTAKSKTEKPKCKRKKKGEEE